MKKRIFGALLAMLMVCACALGEELPQKLTITDGDGVYDLSALSDNKELLRLIVDGGAVKNAKALSGQRAYPFITLKDCDVPSACAVLDALKNDWFSLAIEDMALEGDLLTAVCACRRLTTLNLTNVKLDSLSPLGVLKKLGQVTLDACEIGDMDSIRVLGGIDYPRYYALTLKRLPEGTDYTGLYRLNDEVDFVTVWGYDEQAPFELGKVRAVNVRYIALPKEDAP